jgi:hypothetical protein
MHFICIGAQKAGTSFLYQLFSNRNDFIFIEKEPHFFTKNFTKKNYIKKYENYLEVANSLNKNTLDFSTTYLYDEKCFERINNYFDELPSIICILRDPLDRAISNIKNNVMFDGNKSLRNIDKNLNEYVYKSSYSKFLPFWRVAEEKNKFKVYLYEDLRKNNESFYNLLCKDLSLKFIEFNSINLRKDVNKSRLPRFILLDNIIRKASQKLISLGLEDLRKNIANSGITDFIREINKSETNEKLVLNYKKILAKKYYDFFIEQSEYVSKNYSLDTSGWIKNLENYE